MSDLNDLRLELTLDLARAVLGEIEPESYTLIGAATGKRLDSGAFVSQVGRTRTLPALGWVARRGGARGADGWLLEIAANGYWMTRASHFRATTTIVALAQELERRGIRYAVRKGLPVADRYPDPGCRPMSDVDVLVPREEIKAANQVLSDLGLEPSRASHRTATLYRLATATEPHRFLEDGQGPRVAVQFAYSVLPPRGDPGGTSLSTPSLLDRCSKCDAGFWRLCPEDHFLDTLVNLYVTSTVIRFVAALRFQRLTSYIDLLLMLRADPSILNSVAKTADEVPLIASAWNFFAVHVGSLFPELDLVSPFPVDERGAHTVGAWDAAGEGFIWQLGIRSRFAMQRYPEDLPRPSEDHAF